MTRETVNLTCAELPGAEKEPGPHGTDLWTAGHRPFARVGERVEVREGERWVALPPLSPHGLRERLVMAYEAARASLPPEAGPSLDRTSG